MAVAALSPSLGRLRDAVVAKAAAPTAGAERSILSDEGVQVRYPDGRVVISGPGCGFTTINPEGSVFKALCNQGATGDVAGAPK